MKFTTVKSEGGLIPFDILEKIYSGDIIGQSAKDFGIENGTVLDEISKSWKAARTFYGAFQLRLNRLKPDETTVRDTREQWIKPLLETLGFPNITYFAKADEVAGKTYAISHRANDNRESLPIHIVGIKDNLDKRAESGRPRLSPHSLMQEYLNHTEHLWGIVTNGYSLRLLRDSSKISRPVFIEFDLQQILEQEKFNEFALLFRLIHYSRLPKHQDDAADCFIDKYYNEAINTGGRVRDKLRDGVEEALKVLGNGFLIHPDNKWLRDAIAQNDIKAIEYYRQLLRLVYRLLFLMVSEERNLVGPTDPKKEPIYYNFYSINRLRELSHSFIPGISKPTDLWESLLVTFKLYSDEGYGEKLSIAALNGDLFGVNAIPYFEKCKLYNRDLLSAVKHISQYEDNGNKRRINYLALDVEELGSVYESLLDFHPVMQVSSESNIQFQLVFGSERKTTGSYYTNHDLVHELIESALVPVIKRVTSKQISSDQKVKELLQLKVCDTSMGSGHFLLAAARRIANEIASLRSGEDYPTPTEFRIAIRDVIQRCIYGVDLNPLAVDLCKLALWLEGHTKSKPLSFLDHRIRNGNSLIGAFSYEQIKKGIPDEAFNPVTGDDKEVAKFFKKRNKEERKGQLSLFAPAVADDITTLSKSFSLFDELSIDTTDDYHKAEDEFNKLKDSPQWMREWHLANIWTYAFFAELTYIDDRTVPTQMQLLNYLSNSNSPNAQLIGIADAASLKNKFFHWFLEFPDVFARGGFDCILGNPPWEKIQPEEQQYFATRNQTIALTNGSDRKKMIKELEKVDPVLFREWIDFKKEIENQSIFIRNSLRYLYSNEGRINTYSLFTELGWQLINNTGHCGIIVQTGIATDDSNKKLFTKLIQGGHILSFIDFENREALFPSVHREQRFCLLTITKIIDPENQTRFSFWLSLPQQLEDDYRIFRLGREELDLLSPNTGNCPMFYSRYEAEIILNMYRNTTVLLNEVNPVNNWQIEFNQFVNMTSDSENFIDRINKENFKENELIKLYEGKLTHQFDHRYTTFEKVDDDNYQKGNPRAVLEIERQNENFNIEPRYWLHISFFDSIYNSINWRRNWFLSFHSITNPNNERTSIFSIIPLSGVGNSSPIIISNEDYKLLVVLCSIGNCFAFDFIARRRIASRNFNFFILKQLPVVKKELLNIPNSTIGSTISKWTIDRVLEMSFTSNDLAPFAQDCGYNGPPFIWDEERRFLIRCELDALYFKLYGLNREEADYVMETFPIVKRKEIDKHGEYRTKRVILEIFDEMLECEKQGKQYQTKLDPPPADLRVAHKE
ncbi:MAG: restriction endonuclease [Ignavibacterium sp.]|nr:restriction endonuclease [Ignavibacterium sp.]